MDNKSISSAPSKRSIKDYLLPYLGFFILLFLFKLLRRGPEAFLQLSHLSMLLGGLVGLGIGVADRLIYAYFTAPTEKYSVQIKNLLRQWRVRDAVIHMYQKDIIQRKLATNNVIFLAVWVVLALFLITSSLTGFSQGLILGIGIVLVLDLIKDGREPALLQQRLFWPIARPVTRTEMQTVIYFFFGAFCFLSLLAI